MSLFPLRLAVDMRQVPMAEIGSKGARASGLRLGLWAGVGSGLGVLLGFLLVARFGPMTYDKEFLRLSVPVALGLTGAVVTSALWRASAHDRFWDELQNAPFHAKPRSFDLTHEGIAHFETDLISWAFVTEILEYSSGIALLYTPANYIPIPDGALPTGVSRADLIDEIKAHLT